MRGEIYFDEKQRKKRRRILKWKIYGGIAVFFILIIGVGYLIIYSPFFRIMQLNVSGIQIDANADKIINNLKIYFTEQSKISKFLGSNNILIWKQEKTDEFLKKWPETAKITIKKNYFKRQIDIEVKERKKFGVWCQQNETITCWWFDKNGILFAEMMNIEGRLINKVSDFSNRQLNLGDKALDDKFFHNLVKIFEVLEQSGLKIKSLKLKDLELQEVITESLPALYFSLRFNPEFALSAIQSLKKTGINNLEYIDFRVNNKVYYK